MLVADPSAFHLFGDGCKNSVDHAGKARLGNVSQHVLGCDVHGMSNIFWITGTKMLKEIVFANVVDQPFEILRILQIAVRPQTPWIIQHEVRFGRQSIVEQFAHQFIDILSPAARRAERGPRPGNFAKSSMSL